MPSINRTDELFLQSKLFTRLAINHDGDCETDTWKTLLREDRICRGGLAGEENSGAARR